MNWKGYMERGGLAMGRVELPSFKSRKEEIKDAITEYLNVVDAIAKSQEVKQEVRFHLAG